MKKLPFSLRLLLLCISLIKTFIFSKDCSNEDIGSYLTRCDEYNKRKGKTIKYLEYAFSFFLLEK
jgi:hypothetical protein